MSAVAAILEQEIEHISRFVAVLNSEQEILKQGQTEGLPEFAQQKTALAEQLNTLEQKRLTALGLADNPNSKGQMESWLAEHLTETVAAVNWQNLLNLAREAKALNEINSQLVEMHLRRTVESLAVLTNQGEKQPLYGASGQAMATTGSRIVDSA